jgi:hypothetical protein
MLSFNDVMAKFQQNRDWIGFSLLSAALCELGLAHEQTSDAHNYTAQLTQEIMDTIATGNMTLIQMLVPSLNETYQHCVHETNHHQDNANTSYLLAGGAIAVTAVSALVMVKSFWTRNPAEQGYSHLSVGDDLDGERATNNARQGTQNKNWCCK